MLLVYRNVSCLCVHSWQQVLANVEVLWSVGDATVRKIERVLNISKITILGGELRGQVNHSSLPMS